MYSLNCLVIHQMQIIKVAQIEISDARHEVLAIRGKQDTTVIIGC